MVTVVIQRYYIVTDYILHTVYFIPLTHLFHSYKFVFLISLTYICYPPSHSPLATTFYLLSLSMTMFLFYMFIPCFIFHIYMKSYSIYLSVSFVSLRIIQSMSTHIVASIKIQFCF